MTNWQNYKRVVFGIKGLFLSDEEKEFFTQHKPVGFIIFKRNIESLQQLKELTTSLKVLSDSDEIPILIDQEGGRVARLRPPLFEEYPAAKTFGDLAKDDLHAAIKATFINYYSIGLGLKQLGINVNCAPVADLIIPDAHSIIGDRSFSEDSEAVMELSWASIQGLKAAGVQAIIKHLPGHGRAKVDSHEDLPIISEDLATLEQTDFKVFQALAEVNWAMTAHIIYESLDPDHPATQSPIVLGYIRKKIGFDNIIISDDLCMKALSGDYNFKAKTALDAGCDLVLHCNGDIEQMREVIEGVGYIDKKISDKFDLYLEQLKTPMTEKLQSYLQEPYCEV